MKKRYVVLAFAALVTVLGYYYFLAGFFAGYGPRPVGSDDPLATISLPKGFSIEVYAEVPSARSLALSDSGVLFVGTRDSDKVYAVVDGEVKVIAS
jgi:hypothetical protein